jgi:hypothetical protein
VESRKTRDEKNRFLSPVEHGPPPSKGVDYEGRERATARARAATPAAP